MQDSHGSTTGHAGRWRKAEPGLHEGIVALSLVLPRPHPRGGALERGTQALLALCPFVTLGRGSRPGEPGAVPGGRGPLAMPWSEPRWWGWQPAQAPAPQSDAHGPVTAGSHTVLRRVQEGHPVDGELPTPARRAPAESLHVLLTLLPAVRWIERAPQRPGPRGAASRSSFRWGLQPPIALLPGLSRVPPVQGQASGGSQPLAALPDRDLPWRPAGTAPPGLPAAAPTAPAARDPRPRDGGAASVAVPWEHTAGGALPGLAALDAVRAVPYAVLRDWDPTSPTRWSATPGGGTASARVDALPPPFAAEPSPRSSAQARRDAEAGQGWAPAGPFGSGRTGGALPLPWPDPRPAAPGREPSVQGGLPLSPAENEPGPYAHAAVRGLAAIADAFQAAERLVERRVKVEVARASKRVRAEVDEQLRAQGRQAAAELVSDEALQALMQKLRALAREERFREGRLR